MDNNSGGNDGQQRSALPRSLIPHLYSAPQTSRDSSTRTTLPEQEEEEEDPESQAQQRSASPFALRSLPSEYPSQSPPLASRRYPPSYPVYDHLVQPSSEPEMRLPPTVPIRNHPPYYTSRAAHAYNFPQMENQQSYMTPPAWRQGEPGPSTVAQRGQFNVYRERQHSSRLPQDYRYADQYQQPQHRESYSRQDEQYPNYGAYTQGHPFPQHGMDTLLSSSQAHRQSPEHHIYVEDPPRSGHQHLYTLPPSGQQSGSVARGWDPPIASSSSTPMDYSSSSYLPLPPLPQSSRYSTEPEDDDGEYLPPGRRNPKRKLESSEQESGSRPKKTLIACDFCRGRKLRCDGTRPSCSNCRSRDNQPCMYQSHPRRRGPGKAPRGQRKKKAAATTSASERSRASNEGSQRYSTSGDDIEVDRLVPDFRSQQQQHLPPISILPYPGLPQGGMILASSSQVPQGETPYMTQNQDINRGISEGNQETLQSHYNLHIPTTPTDNERRSERTDSQLVRRRNI
ncbi:hypothetical protein GGU11DRAFT_216447 [Lentinula aff. detonsa]|nr:hypothetical protein GGU11DRAFT_216447 [Lentinula aff. detonsa]